MNGLFSTHFFVCEIVWQLAAFFFFLIVGLCGLFGDCTTTNSSHSSPPQWFSYKPSAYGTQHRRSLITCPHQKDSKQVVQHFNMHILIHLFNTYKSLYFFPSSFTHALNHYSDFFHVSLCDICYSHVV